MGITAKVSILAKGSLWPKFSAHEMMMSVPKQLSSCQHPQAGGPEAS